MKKLLVTYKSFVNDGASESMLNLMLLKYLEIRYFKIIDSKFHFIAIILVYLPKPKFEESGPRIP